MTASTTWTLEAAEAELNRFIDRRAERSTEQRPEEVMYAESVRRYHARQDRERLWEALRHSEAMIKAHRTNLDILVRRHELIIARCEEALGITKGAA